MSQDEHFHIRGGRSADQAAAYYVCLKTGDHGRDGEPFYSDDPDALGRIFVGPYLVYEPDLSLVVEDEQGACGYAFGAFDSREFYAHYEAEWRPQLCAQFPLPQGDPYQWTRAQLVHSWYHRPDYFCPEPYTWEAEAQKLQSLYCELGACASPDVDGEVALDRMQ